MWCHDIAMEHVSTTTTSVQLVDRLDIGNFPIDISFRDCVKRSVCIGSCFDKNFHTLGIREYISWIKSACSNSVWVSVEINRSDTFILKSSTSVSTGIVSFNSSSNGDTIFCLLASGVDTCLSPNGTRLMSSLNGVLPPIAPVYRLQNWHNVS